MGSVIYPYNALGNSAHFPLCKRGIEGDFSSGTKFKSPLVPPLRQARDRLFQSGEYFYEIQRGFTLLEMLVVLVVMSIMLGIVTVKLMPDEQAQLREEAQRLAALMDQAGASARAAGLPLAWSGTGKEFRFWNKSKQGEWQRVEKDSLLRSRSLAGDVRIGALEIGGRAMPPGTMVLLSPETAAPLFRIRLVSGERQVKIAGNGLGAVSVMPR